MSVNVIRITYETRSKKSSVSVPDWAYQELLDRHAGDRWACSKAMQDLIRQSIAGCPPGRSLSSEVQRRLFQQLNQHPVAAVEGEPQ